MDAQDFLTSQGIRLRSYAVGSHKTTCPWCSADRRKRADPCLSVTVHSAEDAVWSCHHCGTTGGTPKSDYLRRDRKPAYRRPPREANPQRPAALLDWFASRGISAKTVEAAGIYLTRHWFPQIEAEAECVAFPFEWRGALRNVKYRDASKNFAQEKNPEPVLYGADTIEAGADLICVEGEIDVLAMREAGFTAVVSLPNGAPAKPEASDRRYDPLQTHADQLENVARFLIATDMDGPGEILANELARRLGKDRCWRVRFPNAGDVLCKDANECLVDHGADVLRECVANATPWPIDGLHGADDYLVDVLALYRGDGPRPLSTGFPELDKAFMPMPGQFIAVTGIPNHGKSRVVDQIAKQMADLHGWKWVVFSPETGIASHIADLCEIYAGAPFFDGPTRRMGEADMQHAFANVSRDFKFIEAKDHTPSVEWILERARAAVLRHGIRGLIIDPWNEVEAGRPTHMTETEFISQSISKFKRFGQLHDVSIWMVIHPTKLSTAPGETKEPMPGMYDMAGSAHWRNKADAGLVVYRDYDEGKTLIVSKKIRRQPMCGVPGVVEMVFTGHDRRFHEVPRSYRAAGRPQQQRGRA